MSMWLPSLPDGPQTRMQAIVDAMATDIAAGRLQAGDRLPPQRDLARALGLSPNTVMRAYAEAARRGYLEGQVGRGTYVRLSGAGTVPALTLARPCEGPIDLSVGLPFVGDAGEALSATLADLSGSGKLTELLDHGGSGLGRRHALSAASWIARLGLPSQPDNVVFVNGAQHGLLAALLALLRPGDTLLTESLTYAPIKELARQLGVRVQAIAGDEEGLTPDALDAACRAGSAGVLYCMPTLHTPTTVTISEPRRREIARVAAAHDLTIVEDDVYGFLPRVRPLPLAVFAPERTILVTSVSKSMAPGLRVGYVHAPESLVPAIRAAVAVTSWMPPPLMAEIAHRWIGDGTAVRLNERQRRHAERRQAMARESLSPHRYHADPNGFHVWLPLPDHWSSRAFVAAAERSGVLVNPAEAFATAVPAVAAVRLCLSHETSDQRVRQGLAIISALLDRPAEDGSLVI